MHTLYIDADACPVKDEAYRVARRYSFQIKVVANAPMRVPADLPAEMVVCQGFNAADDWIAERCGPGDVVVTADVPLAARGVAAGSAVLGPKGVPWTADNVGVALGVRDLMESLRSGGAITGGPSPMTPKDRSRFLGKLDELMGAARRKFPATPPPATSES